jgi:hypothetical protein
MPAPRIAGSLLPFVLVAVGPFLVGVSGCTEREPPPPREAAIPEAQAPESRSTTPDTLRGDSLMARDTLWNPE